MSNSCYIGNIFGETSASGIPVIVNSNNKLGTTTSSKRFKENIKPMDKASETLYALAPVTFQYKKEIDRASTAQFGLVAEEVERVHPDLVVCDKEGEPYTVRYEAVNAMLLNEFLKEHKAFLKEQRKNEEQGATISQLRSTVAQQQKDFRVTVAQLTARLDEQAAQIEKVNAQLASASPSRGGLEARKPAPQVVSNNQ